MWLLTCLLCHPSGPKQGHDNLVEMQEHAMEFHDVAQEDFRRTMREGSAQVGYRWRLPDGRLWLATRKVG
jgi:hypothetical protein